MNIKKIIKGLLISIITLAVGYFAIAVPFDLVSSASSLSAGIIFAVELGIYLFVGAVFIIVTDRKEEKARKEKARQYKRIEKRKQAQEEYYSLAA